MTPRPNAAEVAELLAERMPELARDLAGDPSHRGRSEWRYRGINGGTGALAVHVGGPRRGTFHDFHADAGGDALALVAHMRREPMGAAYAWALAWLGLAGGGEVRPAPRPPVAPPEAPREACPAAPSETLELARRLRREAMPADAPGSLVPGYLAARGGLVLPDAPDVLRFHPRAWRNRENGPHGPAMVADMTDPVTNEWTGVHVTYLRPDGSGKAEGERQKIMLGRAGCIRLVEDAEVTMGLGLAEGIETALAVMQRAGWSPVWAATSAGAVKRFPVLPHIEALTIFADMDGAGLDAARECGRRWAAAGREARLLAPPAGDWNDVLRHGERSA